MCSSDLQIQDANLSGSQSIDVPYLWLEAFAHGLAVRLAQIWAPEKAAALQSAAEESYDIASRQNIETAQQYISPQIAGYFR